MSSLSLLALGLSFGLKHALEADHLAAVSTIVSERRSLRAAALIGGLWGVGHTLALLVAGVGVIVLHVQVGARLALALEFAVALMLVGLGLHALVRIRRGARLHLHAHRHGGHLHVHPHFHRADAEGDESSHHGLRLGLRPLLVGVVHGLAGSAALMLLVLSTIPSAALGFAYIGAFGLGSIGGMMAMGFAVGLPVRLAGEHFARAHVAVRTLAALFSLGLGLFLAYRIGFVDGLLA